MWSVRQQEMLMKAICLNFNPSLELCQISWAYNKSNTLLGSVLEPFTWTSSRNQVKWQTY